AQYFFIGILLADFYVSNTAAAFFNKKSMVFVALICLIAIVYWPIEHQFYNTGLQAIIVHLSFPFLLGLFYYIVMKNDLVRRAFSYKFIPIIGGMCYSIYLLHYTIISFLGRFTLRLHITNYYLPNLFLQVILIGIPVLL